MIETDLAWAAGIVDGEGSIVLVKNAGKHHPSYILRLRVGNTDIRMLHKLQELFGGKIYNEPHYSNPRAKMAWAWMVNSADAEMVIQKVLPYLIVKKEQAEIGLLFRKYARNRYSKRGPNPNFDQISSLRGQLSALNQRGRHLQ